MHFRTEFERSIAGPAMFVLLAGVVCHRNGEPVRGGDLIEGKEYTVQFPEHATGPSGASPPRG